MKRLIFVGILFISAWYFGFAQVTSEPSFPTADNEIRIIYNATLGTTGLVGATKVYMHSGVILDSPTGTSWQNVVGNWGQDDGIGLMTKVAGETDKWEITLTPRNYFNLDVNQAVYRIGMVFRNPDGTQEGKTDSNTDIFLELSQGGIDFTIDEPTSSILFVDQNGQIQIVATASEAVDFTLNIGGVIVDIQTGILTYNYTHTVTESSGEVDVILLATDGITSVERGFTYAIRGITIVEARPPGIISGINYGLDNTKVTLSLLAPNSTSVYVIGDFTNWEISTVYQMKLDGEHFWLEITGLTEGQEYAFQYLVDESIFVADPFADKILDPDDSSIPSIAYPNLMPYPNEALHAEWFYNRLSVIQTAQIPYAWQNIDFVMPLKKDLVIYELLIRDFFANGQENYDNLIDTLSYIKGLGVNAIELMPITEFNGNDSWGYNNVFMFAPDKIYGTKNKLKEFIDTAHGLGIAIILDVVMNHHDTPAPYALLDFSTQGLNKVWFNTTAPHQVLSFFNDLNHSSPYTQNYLDTINHYWLNEFNFDGFRFDLSKGFTQKITTGYDDWAAFDAGRIAILKRMADKIWEHTPDAYIILEHFADNSEEIQLSDHGMMLWGNIHWAYKQNALGFSDGSDIGWIYHGNRRWNDPHLIGYMESHDEQRLMYENLTYGNSAGSYNVMNLTVGLDRMKAIAAFFYTIPGPKMLWQFGELGYDIDIDFNGRVGQKPIPWNNVEGLNYNNEGKRLELKQYVSALIDLKNTYSIFSTPNVTFIGGNTLIKQIILTNEVMTSNPSSADEMNVLIIGNFDVTENSINAEFQHTGSWYNYFDKSKNMDAASIPVNITLSPGEFRLYTDFELPSPNIITALDDKRILIGNMKIYPNPFSDFLNIDNDDKSEPYKAKISDILGRVQHTSPLYSDNNKIDLSKLKSGLYLLILEDSKGRRLQFKLVKE